MGGKDKKERREKRLQEISLLRTIPYSDHQRWWTDETIAVVTGGNRGIGFEMTRQLADHGLTVVLTSRDENVGIEAVKVLQEAGLKVEFHQLDIVDPASIQKFAEWIQETHGGMDILVNYVLTENHGRSCTVNQINNAGVNFNIGSDNSVEHAEQVIRTNYYATKDVIKAVLPIMKPSKDGARIVNVSSRLGRLNGKRNRINNDALREELSDIDSLTEEQIDNIVNKFLEQVKDETWTEGGWPQTFTDYSVSKLAINCYTRVLGKELSDRPEGEKICVNCFCPGWVKTAMTGWVGNISVEDGADTGVWLALLPGQPASGKFFAERRETSF